MEYVFARLWLADCIQLWKTGLLIQSIKPDDGGNTRTDEKKLRQTNTICFKQSSPTELSAYSKLQKSGSECKQKV